MKARARFYARGQSDQARGIPFAPWLQRSWPQWAQDAYRKGWHDTPISRAAFPALWAYLDGLPPKDTAAPFKLPDLRGYYVPASPRHDMGTYRGVQAALRHLDPEAMVSKAEGINVIDVLTTLDPQTVRDMLPLGIKVNHRHRGDDSEKAT